MRGRREIDYDEFLPDSGEFLRVRFSTEGREVVAVVRYDAQHGKAQRDTLNRRGEVIDKHWLGMSNAEALDFGKRDRLSNWRRYRDAFLEKTQ